MGWYDLTLRQQELDREIEKCGITLDASRNCLNSRSLIFTFGTQPEA